MDVVLYGLAVLKVRSGCEPHAAAFDQVVASSMQLGDIMNGLGNGCGTHHGGRGCFGRSGQIRGGKHSACVAR